MDIRAYFHKLREIERSIGPEDVVIVTQNTADGGREGRYIEVARDVAARMIVEGSGRLATEAEAQEFRDRVATQIEQAQAEAEASRVRLLFTTDRQERILRPVPKTKG